MHVEIWLFSWSIGVLGVLWASRVVPGACPESLGGLRDVPRMSPGFLEIPGGVRGGPRRPQGGPRDPQVPFHRVKLDVFTTLHTLKNDEKDKKSNRFIFTGHSVVVLPGSKL